MHTSHEFLSHEVGTGILAIIIALLGCYVYRLSRRLKKAEKASIEDPNTTAIKQTVGHD